MYDLVSSTTRRAFQKSYARFAVLQYIRTDFDDAGVVRKELPADYLLANGERRSLVESYYLSIDWTSRQDVRRVLDAFESHLFRLAQDIYDSSQEEARRLIEHLESDGLTYTSRKIILPLTPFLDEHLIDQTLSVDVSQLKINIARIRDAVDSDPALAIGAAKELVEACCKAILVEMEETVGQSEDIPQLIKKTAKVLALLPEEISDEKKGVEAIRRVLGSLANIVQGMAELRNFYGSGHGRIPGHGSLQPRHARLCAGAASTLTVFLVETAQARRE